VQDEVEALLRQRFPRSFTASEVAESLGITKSSARRHLKRLTKDGKVVLDEGRYHSAVGPSAKDPHQLEMDIEKAAAIAGVSPDVMYKWADDLKKKIREKKSEGS
jgi:DNA-binding transcriptional ArsR family regulator